MHQKLNHVLIPPYIPSIQHIYLLQHPCPSYSNTRTRFSLHTPLSLPPRPLPAPSKPSSPSSLIPRPTKGFSAPPKPLPAFNFLLQPHPALAKLSRPHHTPSSPTQAVPQRVIVPNIPAASPSGQWCLLRCRRRLKGGGCKFLGLFHFKAPPRVGAFLRYVHVTKAT